MKDIKFDLAYIVRYSPRPGTASFKLGDNVSLREKKVRENKLTRILSSTALANNKKYFGKTVKLLVEGKGKTGQWFGITATEINVKFIAKNNKNNLIGKFVNVKIIEAKDFGLEGEIINYEKKRK